MSKKLVEEVVELQSRINELDSFIFLASRNGFWEKILYEKRLTFFTNVRGFANDDTKIRLDKDLTLKLLEVFKEERDRLQVELDGAFRGREAD